MIFDLDSPDFDTAEMLACCRGLKRGTLSKWESEKTLSLSTGLGEPGVLTKRTGRDIMQVALKNNLSRQGVLNRGFDSVWKIVDQRISRRSAQGAADTDRATAIFHVDDAGYLKVLLVDDAKFLIGALGELDRLIEENQGDEAGGAIRVIVQLDRFIDDMVARMQSIIDTRDDYLPKQMQADVVVNRCKVAS